MIFNNFSYFQILERLRAGEFRFTCWLCATLENLTEWATRQASSWSGCDIPVAARSTARLLLAGAVLFAAPLLPAAGNADETTEPTVTISAGPSPVTEGGPAIFTLTLSRPAPPGGLAVNLTVSEPAGSHFVAPSNEGANQRTIPAGWTRKTHVVPTFNDGNREPDGSVTLTLTSGTGYTVGTPDSASMTVRDNDSSAPPFVDYTIYHDPDHSAGARDRYDEAVELLEDAGQSYAVKITKGTGTVDAVAGVSNSAMPRFFLGDLDKPGWGPSQPGVNNGGLRWLRKELAKLPDRTVTISVERYSSLRTEGWSLVFDVSLSRPAPRGGLTVNLSVSERRGSHFVAASDKGAKQLTIGEGLSAQKYVVPTVNDRNREPGGAVSVTVKRGTGYRVGPPGSHKATLTIPDNDLSSPPFVDFTIYHDPAQTDTWDRYDTAVALLEEAGRSYATKIVSGTDEVDRVAGVTNSAMPRFFLGDLEEPGWGPSDPGSNNGDLEWLRGQLAPQQPKASPAPAPTVTSIYIYHDPNISDAVSRYDTAITLLKSKKRSYIVRTVTGNAEVDRLAGVSNSVLPRFFLGDPAAAGWGPAQTKVNNGGLRWLRGLLTDEAETSSAASDPAVSVADAQVTEGAGAALAFTVTLDRAPSGAASVDYATADGTATAGTDYTATSGTLTFAAGETSKTVSVRVLDDAHDEGEETLRLTLSNPSGLRLADGEATGTIRNTDPMPQAWLVRFGRAAADQAVDAVTARFNEAGDSQATLGGYRVWEGNASAAGGGDAADAFGHALGAAMQDDLPQHGAARRGAGAAHSPAEPAMARTGTVLTAHDLLRSSFRLTSGGEDSARLTAWGRASALRFDGIEDGLALDGQVATYLLGADAEWDRWLAGVALAHSAGDGGYRNAAGDEGMGKLDSALTAVHPYIQYRASDRLSAWGMLGYGFGDLTLSTAGGKWRTDTSMHMAAGGARGVFVRGDSGLELALRLDARLTRIESDAAANELGNLAAATGGTSSLRLLLEGTRTFHIGAERALTPTLELGVRRDGGDAETGAGVDLGGALRYADAALGLVVDMRGRYLAAHRDTAYREWGASASVVLDPGRAGRGLALSLSPSWGAEATGGAARLWSITDARGLAGGNAGGGMRLDADVGYGFALRRGLLTPFAEGGLAGDAGRRLRLGARFEASRTNFGAELAGERSESGSALPDHALRLDIRLDY